MPSFGEVVSSARKEKMISQKDLASEIKKEDGDPISQQYLSDIEHGRRVPSSEHLIEQFADLLDLDADYLSTLAGEIPEDVKESSAQSDEERIRKAWSAFRRELK